MTDYENEFEQTYLPLKHRLYHLTIREAAELIAVDMWVSGEFPDIEEPEGWEGSDRDPMLIPLLAEQIKHFESRLVAAVESGRLKARNLIRTFDEKLIDSKPQIRFKYLEGWLNDHGYLVGDTFAGWIQTESEIEGKLEEEFDYLRALSRSTDKRAIDDLPRISDGPVRLDEIDSMGHANVVSAYKALVVEYDRMAKLVYGDGKAPARAHDAKVDRPLTTRQRRTFLTVIAAMCKYEGFDPQGRGTAQRIMEMTDDIGAHVDDGTIAKILSEIPDALETRMK